MGDITMMDYHELDVLCGQLQQDNAELQKKVEMLEQECRALRDQLKYAEQQVYNGPTM
jgi:cell division protein FtsB